jgi:hypothetical protein
MKTFTIGDKTYSEDQFAKIMFVQKLVKELAQIQDSLYRDLGTDMDVDNDWLFDLIYNDCSENVKVNNE